MSEVDQIMVEVIRTDKAQSGIIWVDGGGWIQKRTGCAGTPAMSAARPAGIPGLAVMHGRCTPKPAK